MHMGEQAVLDGVKKYGPSAGGKAMMDFEHTHALEAVESGLYVTYWSVPKKIECGRIGSLSLCFCGHGYPDHDINVTKRKQSTKCGKCKCKAFKYVPRRPEECGMWWLPRRKDFDMKSWKAKCKCGKAHDDHQPVPPYRAKRGKGSCSGFWCDFACISCDCRWEDHEMLYEFEHDRMMEGKKVGDDYVPLSMNKELQNLVFKTDRNKLPQYNRTRKKPVKKKRGAIGNLQRGSTRGRGTKRIRGRGTQRIRGSTRGANSIQGGRSSGRGRQQRTRGAPRGGGMVGVGQRFGNFGNYRGSAQDDSDEDSEEEFVEPGLQGYSNQNVGFGQQMNTFGMDRAPNRGRLRGRGGTTKSKYRRKF